MQQEQQMHGADGGEGMAGDDDDEEYQDLGQISEAEYMKLVAAEQERLAREQEGMEGEDDEEGLDDEIIEQLREAFDACDGDKDGALTKDELENLLTSLGGQLNDEVLERIMQAADANKDGKMQFEQFIMALEGPL